MDLLSSVGVLLLTMDPLGNVPNFVAVLHQVPAERRTGVVVRELLIALALIDAAIKRFWADTESRYKFLKADRERPILEPKEIFLGAEDFFVRAKPHGRWAIARASSRIVASSSSHLNIALPSGRWVRSLKSHTARLVMSEWTL